MAVKTLTITEQAYNRIKSMKEGDESFSELFLRITSGNINVAKRFFGAARLSEEDIKKWRNTVTENRRLDNEIDIKKQKSLQKRIKELNL